MSARLLLVAVSVVLIAVFIVVLVATVRILDGVLP